MVNYSSRTKACRLIVVLAAFGSPTCSSEPSVLSLQPLQPTLPPAAVSSALPLYLSQGCWAVLIFCRIICLRSLPPHRIPAISSCEGITVQQHSCHHHSPVLSASPLPWARSATASEMLTAPSVTHTQASSQHVFCTGRHDESQKD